MVCTANIGWLEILIGGIVGAVIGLFAQRILDFIFGFRHLRPLIGEYIVTYKNGETDNIYKEVKVTKVKGRILFVESMTTKVTKPILSEIYFQTPKSGKGWYRHTDSDSFGMREIVIMNNKKLAVWDTYSKDDAYKDSNKTNDSKMYSSVEKSYIWVRK